eukprot:29854-Hanusia_phi.AAC.1
MSKFQEAQKKIKRLKSAMELRPDLNKVRLLKISELSKRMRQNAVFELELLKRNVRLLETRYQEADANVTGMIQPLMPNAIRLRDELRHARFVTDLQIVALDKTMNATMSALGRFLWLKQSLEKDLQEIAEAQVNWRISNVQLEISANLSLEENLSREREGEESREVLLFEDLFLSFYNAESQSFEHLESFEKRSREHLEHIERLMADILYAINISSTQELKEIDAARQNQDKLNSDLHDVNLGALPTLVEQLEALNESIAVFREDFMSDMMNASRSFQTRWSKTLTTFKQMLLDRIDAKEDSYLARQKRLLHEANASSWNSIQSEFVTVLERLHEEENSMSTLANSSARQLEENDKVVQQLEQTLKAMDDSLQERIASEGSSLRDVRRFSQESQASLRGEQDEDLESFTREEAEELQRAEMSLGEQLQSLVQHAMLGNLSSFVRLWDGKRRNLEEEVREMVGSRRDRLKQLQDGLHQMGLSFNHTLRKLSHLLHNFQSSSAANTSNLRQSMRAQEEATNSSVRSISSLNLWLQLLQDQIVANLTDSFLRARHLAISSWTRTRQQELREGLTELEERVEKQRNKSIGKLLDFEARLQQAQSDEGEAVQRWNSSAEALRQGAESTTRTSWIPCARPSTTSRQRSTSSGQTCGCWGGAEVKQVTATESVDRKVDERLSGAQLDVGEAEELDKQSAGCGSRSLHSSASASSNHSSATFAAASFLSKGQGGR